METRGAAASRRVTLHAGQPVWRPGGSHDGAVAGIVVGVKRFGAEPGGSIIGGAFADAYRPDALAPVAYGAAKAAWITGVIHGVNGRGVVMA
jgi:hypothetical protein